MMTLPELDLALRAGELWLLALIAAILLRDHRSALPARLALAMIAGVICHIIAERKGLFTFAPAVQLALLIGESSLSAFFWLFVRSWFNDEVRIGWRSWALVVGMVALSLLNFAFYSQVTGNYAPTDIPMRIAWLAFPVAGLWIAWSGRENDLIEARRRLRIGFVWAAGIAVVGVNIVYFVTNQVLHTIAPIEVTLGVMVAENLVVAGLAFTLFQLRRADIFAPTPPMAPPEDVADDPASEALATRVQGHMRETLAYRDDTLSIAGLAAQLGEQEYRLRRVINGRMGYRNFAAFLNGYRLAEVKSALRDASQREVPILTIALDAGFGSLAPFNRAFREAEGCTPSEFRASALIALPA
jgi:AraC-like DNA-binding protein